MFHSEADFQHALAWQLRRRRPDCAIRLEYRVAWDGPRSHVDLWVRSPAEPVAVELKYWTRRLRTEFDGEAFQLSDQAAQDLSRYDFLKDLQRVERLVSLGLAASGHVIALTNDPGYWITPRAGTVDAAFRLHQGRTIAGRLDWAPHAGAGTTRGRETPIELTGSYALSWRRYSVVHGEGAGEFRYLLASVAAP